MKASLRFVLMASVASLLGLSAALSACSSGQSLSPDDVKMAPDASSYQKPGAAIDVSFEAPKSLAGGEYGVLKITVKDYYAAGTAYLEARPEDGVRFVSETARKELSLSTNEPFEWELDIIGSRDGVFYVNVTAMVDLPGGEKTGRAYSGRIVIGDPAKAKIDPQKGMNGTLSSDGRSIVMQAEEVIK